jgi:hypothetical protein
MRKLTTEQFKEKSQKVHGPDTWGYSRVVYKNNRTDVELECPIHGFFWQIPHNHLSGKGCPKCKNQTKSTEKFIEDAQKINGDNFGYSRVVYKNAKTDVELECPIHGFFWQKPYHHLRGAGCPKCGIIKSIKNRAKSTEKFIEDAQKINGNKFGYSRVVYKNNRTDVELECFEHGFFWQKPYHHLSGHGCPKCKSSKGELAVQKFLEEQSIEYIHQHKFPDCVDINPLVFDFYIPQLNLCIEYDGEHHFHPVNYSGDMEVAKLRHEDTVRKDQIKKDYCKNNKIHLINIGYSINDIPEYIKKHMKKNKIDYEFPA